MIEASTDITNAVHLLVQDLKNKKLDMSYWEYGEGPQKSVVLVAAPKGAPILQEMLRIAREENLVSFKK